MFTLESMNILTIFNSGTAVLFKSRQHILDTLHLCHVSYFSPPFYQHNIGFAFMLMVDAA